MKRLTLAALAAAMFAAPLALPSEAAAQRWEDRDDRRDRDWRRDRDRDWDGDHRRGDRDRDWDDDDRDYRDGYREGRHDQWRRDRWDDRRYNGYHYQGRWYYGPPPRHYRDAYYDYRGWRRGDRLPRYYRDRYVVVHDYYRYGYRHPPRGYHYVRDDRGDLLLVGIATGVILGIIASQ